MTWKPGLLLLIGLHTSFSVFASTNASATHLTIPVPAIFVEPSAASVGIFGKATLTLGELKHEGNVFSGDYQMKVSPYAFKNENGKLVMVVSDEDIHSILSGNKIAVTGTATSTKTGKTRTIEATAVPKNESSGSIIISFVAGKRKMVFESAYRLAEKGK